MVMTDTWPSDTTEMKVAVKMADAYSSSDLVGAWDLNAMASGPGAPWWYRARFTVAGDGTYIGTDMEPTDSDWQPASGSLSISSDGVVTRAGSSPSSRMVMDAGKTIIVGTETWPDGTTTIGLMTKVE
jgi:hypothetical protein